MMFTEKQNAKMNRLSVRLLKIDYRIYGIDNGFGQPAIFTTDHTLVDGSELWLVDLVEGRLTGPQISKALLEGIKPYDLATATVARKQKTSNTRATKRAQDELRPNEKSSDELGHRRLKCEHCHNDATQVYCVNVTKRYPLSDDATEINWEQGAVVENEDDPIYACEDCGPHGQ